VECGGKLRRKIIGITCDWEENRGRIFLEEAYSEKVAEAGGVPLLVPHLEERFWPFLMGLFDGFVLSGGGDVSPLIMGEEPLSGEGEIFPPRDRMELYLARQCLANHVPLLGICRGMQVINIAAGGTIFQDVNDQHPGHIQHMQRAPRRYPSHRVEVVAGTLLHEIVSRTVLEVNSFHHQAVRDVPAALIVAARSADGIIEAIEGTDSNFILGVQWHPEAMNDHASRAIFASFVASIDLQQ
jgi:putative glutamine amidotransferase